ncbi:LysR family transcriptional regulator [Rhizobium leguminosarum]|jgi:DNA-binding transcriptional LysR family regulator|uniref:HTH-type transcriptional regulator TtuA n=1 Tax=Rhizobium leguminosarum TaxID=384 RepID=A0AAJ1A5I9_RHILE|nr:LysR family transcriptional regulator [Rhizobium leguminosarum]MBY5532237.1 LysR family transcriptional regulator [Rhizobium leguminosarum]MBY5593544.1 LysR family transcriptional regulator [Rhizobium leguminosarum]MBY5627513.1 LysR family transcriptional regulator [Rhizobium leguminosarum]MBY5666442.1 LysR family transcriptional regulator [Rhizobium leguminosarum]MBY5679635.1 LysR family transcriptional regulator [Rhizobium leguminosarum]
MPRTNLNDILIFMAVVDAGSFIAGGQAVGLSRSAAGKAVIRLEDRLGVRLLNRTTRTLSLTEEGRMFYERGLRILVSVDEAEASVAGQDSTPRGVLRLTVDDAFGRLVVLPLLEKYLRAWPDIQVEVSFTDRLADIVEEGFDLAIRVGATATDTRLVSRVIATYKARLCASPSYLAERGEPRNVDDLAVHDCLISAGRNQRQGWRFRGEGGSWIKAQGRSRLRLDSGEAIRDAALAGLGIALLPDFLVTDDLAAGRLRQILADFETDDAKIVTLYPDKRLLEPRVRRFIDLIVEELGRG